MHHPVTGGDPLQGRLRLGEQRMAIATEHADLFAIQRAVFEARPRTAEIGDRQVQLAFDHRQFQLGGRIDEKVQLDILVAPLEARQRIAETGLGQGREIVREAQVQLPDQTSGQRLRLVAKQADGVEHRSRSLQHPAALGGQSEAALAALAEPVAEALLQAGDVHADVRLAHVQLGLGRGETAALHHAGEDAQQTQV